jgi:hypothetical protein
MAFLEAGLLEKFWTCVNWKKNGFLTGWQRRPRDSEGLRRRSFPSSWHPLSGPSHGGSWGEQGAAQIGWEQLTRDEDALFSVDAVYRSLDRRVAQGWPLAND